VNNRLIGVTGGQSVLNVVVNGGPNPGKFSDTSNGYFQTIRRLDIARAIGVVVKDDGIISKGGDGAGFEEMVDDTVRVAWDV